MLLKKVLLLRLSISFSLFCYLMPYAVLLSFCYSLPHAFKVTGHIMDSFQPKCSHSISNILGHIKAIWGIFSIYTVRRIKLDYLGILWTDSSRMLARMKLLYGNITDFICPTSKGL